MAKQPQYPTNRKSGQTPIVRARRALAPPSRDQLRIELRLTEFQRGNVVLFGIGALGAHRDTA
jgi:hypothetical protein